MLLFSAVFDEFMRSYLNHFQSKSLDTDQFKAYLLNYFKGNEKLAQVDWDSWLYKSGMPPVIPEYVKIPIYLLLVTYKYIYF